MVGIIGAMDSEVALLLKKMENRRENTVSGVVFHEGTIGKKDVVVAKCGIGKVFAALTAEAMILNYHPELIVNTGVGGALAKDLDVFDLVIADNVLQHDMDTSPIGDPVGLLSGIDMIRIPTDETACGKFETAARETGIHTLRATVASGDQFIAGKEAKSRIVGNFPDAKACEMEGAAIGQVCFVNKTPFAVLRAISDKADGSSPVDFPTFAAKAAENSAALLIGFLNENN